MVVENEETPKQEAQPPGSRDDSASVQGGEAYRPQEACQQARLPTKDPPMKAGQLVKIKRASIGAPAGAVGLITKVLHSEESFGIYAVSIVGARQGLREVRRLGADLEIISA
tara:strand:+ start:246 stop:581 length:336 start_codon:yes stop_codon:yes gene_type:complete